MEASQDYIKSVTTLYRKRADQFTSISFTPSYATDAFGDTFTQISINIANYQQGDQFFFNGTGIEDAGDGTGNLITNPSDQLKEIAIRYTDLVDADFETSSWNAFQTLYSGFTDSAIAIPWKAGQILPIVNNLFSEAAFSYNVAFYINYEGKIAVATQNDVSQETEDLDTLTDYSAEVNLQEVDISTVKPEIQYYNSGLTNYGIDQSATEQIIDDYTIEDSGSVDFYNNNVNAGIASTFITDEDESIDIASQILLRAAGKAKRIVYPATNMDFLQSVPGERITITHPLANL